MPTQPKTCSISLGIYDGTRQLISSKVQLLIRVIDGNQKQLHSHFRKGPRIVYRGLPFFNNFGDKYTVVVSAKNYQQAGFYPIKVSPLAEQPVDLMLLPKKNKYNFGQAEWSVLKKANPHLILLFSSGASAEIAQNRYAELLSKKPDSAAALLNLVTAMSDIDLPVGNPLGYLKQLIWDESMAEDRFFAWADAQLLDQVKLAAAAGTFQPEPGAGVFHPGATSSYKQIQFGEANVQLTFHETVRKTVGGVSCVKVEPDIDYYKDLGAHTLLEVLPNLLSKGRTDPRVVYVLRWIAGRHAGVPEFDPPYSIE